MPRIEWLRREFSYGYDSGNVLSLFPGRRRRHEQKICGASYREVFARAVRPYIRRDSSVMELGPGAGSWSRAILRHIPEGTLTTVDFQNVEEWLQPGKYGGRLECLQVSDNTFSCVKDGSMDFFWSFGVLCHNNSTHIREILANALPKMKPGAHSAHQYADWKKLDAFGWGDRSTIPADFKDKPDDEIWWPRNSVETMADIASEAGWEVLEPDMGLIQRDGLILLRAPA